MERTSECDTRKEMLPLKDTCLECISRNLSIYSTAFCTTEDADLKRNLEYLRRFHTSYLVEKIHKPMDESYFNFLINENLEELFLDFFDDGNWVALLRRMAEVGHAFKEVYINFISYLEFEENLNFVNEVVRNIPNVETLELYGDFNDTTLEIIASHCPKLKELTIINGSCTSAGLKSLCRETDSGTEAKSPSLKTLSLWETGKFHEGVEFLLRNMPSLEKVGYSQLQDVLYRMHKDDKNISQRKYNLLSLEIDCTFSDKIADMLNIIIEVCPRVTQIQLCIADGEYLDLITRFTELEDLSVIADYFSSVDFSTFLKRRGEGLRILDMRYLLISADILIQSCPKVEILVLKDITFKPLGHGSVLTPLYRLSDLHLDGLNFDNILTQQSVTAVLKSSANLRELSFQSCRFENPRKVVTDLIKCCQSSSLQRLEFTYCGIEEATKTAILTCLDLENTELIVNN